MNVLVRSQTRPCIGTVDLHVSLRTCWPLASWPHGERCGTCPSHTVNTRSISSHFTYSSAHAFPPKMSSTMRECSKALPQLLRLTRLTISGAHLPSSFKRPTYTNVNLVACSFALDSLEETRAAPV